MRRIRYRVASSLDGYIAGPNGEIDWIVHDPSVDFAALFAEFDAALLGRRTYELTLQPGAPPWPPGWQLYVFSQTLPPIRQPAVTLVSSGITEVVSSLRDRPGRDIWLFGGGRLFASLLKPRARGGAMPCGLRPSHVQHGPPLSSIPSTFARCTPRNRGARRIGVHSR